jgi:hypothetical protein
MRKIEGKKGEVSPVQAMKAYKGIRKIAQIILNLGTLSHITAQLQFRVILPYPIPGIKPRYKEREF